MGDQQTTNQTGLFIDRQMIKVTRTLVAYCDIITGYCGKHVLAGMDYTFWTTIFGVQSSNMDPFSIGQRSFGHVLNRIFSIFIGPQYLSRQQKITYLHMGKKATNNIGELPHILSHRLRFLSQLGHKVVGVQNTTRLLKSIVDLEMNN